MPLIVKIQDETAKATLPVQSPPPQPAPQQPQQPLPKFKGVNTSHYDHLWGQEEEEDDDMLGVNTGFHYGTGGGERIHRSSKIN